MEEENFNPCENCPYDDNGWCCCEGGDLPNDALCIEEVFIIAQSIEFSSVYGTEEEEDKRG